MRSLGIEPMTFVFLHHALSYRSADVSKVKSEERLFLKASFRITLVSLVYIMHVFSVYFCPILETDRHGGKNIMLFYGKSFRNV